MREQQNRIKRDWSKVNRVSSAHQISFRVSAREQAQLKEITDRAGVTIAGYVKAAAFGRPIPRASRRPDVDSVALRQLLGHMGKLGSNANQIARSINAGTVMDYRRAQQCLDDITAQLKQMREQLLAALQG
jgi:hypothetical protein